MPAICVVAGLGWLGQRSWHASYFGDVASPPIAASAEFRQATLFLQSPPQPSLTGKVTAVPTGDSLVVVAGKHRLQVRLCGIDAPERDQPLGKAAQAALQQWSNQNPQVQLTPLRQQSGWLIAEVFAANPSTQPQMVNRTLVQAGLACVYSPYIQECPHRWAIVQAEATAKHRQQGQWHSQDFAYPWDHRRWRVVRQLKQQLSSDKVLNPLPLSYLHDGMQNATVGLVSWYGPVLQGRLTANGETFDQNALTAAHSSLPFNTQLRVTNLQNQRSVTVRINDRQPAQNISMLDLSKAAAEKIDAVEDGIVPVEMKILWGGR